MHDSYTELETLRKLQVSSKRWSQILVKAAFAREDNT